MPDPNVEAASEQIRERFQEMRDEMRSLRGQSDRRGGRDAEAEGPEGEENPMSQEERQAMAEDLRTSIRDRFQTLRDEMQTVRDDRTASTQMQEMLDARVQLIRQFAKNKRSLRQSTVEGIRALLSESQLERWDQLERDLRRGRVLSRGRLSGESTDVLEILEQQELEEALVSEELNLLLDSYALDLDRVLVAREDYDYGHGP